MASYHSPYNAIAYAHANIGLNAVLLVVSLVTFVFFMHVQQAPAKFSWTYFGSIIVSSGAFFIAVLLDLIRMAVALNPPTGAASDRGIFEGWVMGTSVVSVVATLLYGITFATLFLGLMGLVSYSIHGKHQAGVVRIVAYAAAAAILVAHLVLFALSIAAVVFSYQASLDSDSLEYLTTRYGKAEDLAEAGNKTAWAVNLLMLLASIFALGRGIQVHFSDKIQNKFTSRLVLLTSFLLVMFAAYTFGFFAYGIDPASGRPSLEAFRNGSQVLGYVLKVILSEIPLFGGLWAVYYAGKGAYKTEHIPKTPRNATVVNTEQTKADDAASSVPEAANQV